MELHGAVNDNENDAEGGQVKDETTQFSSEILAGGRDHLKCAVRGILFCVYGQTSSFILHHHKV